MIWRSLFEYIAQIIDEKISYVEKTFGKESSEIALNNVLEQCDNYISKILDAFIQETELQQLVSILFVEVSLIRSWKQTF